MNDKFFDLPKEKQDRFINAALKVFSVNGYKKASTDEIVKEAGISKGLLFHYFESKQGLYEFVYSYSTKYIRMEYERGIQTTQSDFFDLLLQVFAIQKVILKSYPYMTVFVGNAFRERDEEIRGLIAEDMAEYAAATAGIYERAQMKYFKEGIDPASVLEMCSYISDGILREQLLDHKIDADKFYTQNEAYLHLMKQNFYELK